MIKLFLKILRKVYSKISNKPAGPILPIEMHVSDDDASKMIYDILMDDKPCMIARYGSFELNTMLNARDVLNGKHQYLDYIKGNNLGWWWNQKLLNHMENNAGFFPITEENILRYSKRMFDDTTQLDILGSFARNERLIYKELQGVKRIHLKQLEPFFGRTPWTRALKGRKVLVVHPLASLIEQQYKEHREKLFNDEDILPEFELLAIPAVQSLGGRSDKFKDWFEALEWMEQEIDKVNYDICLIGCGAYGFCLAAHVKRMGKKAFHLGGVLQILFGIKGARWEDVNYNVEEWSIPRGFYANKMNEYWVKPSSIDIPKNAQAVEGGCYW